MSLFFRESHLQHFALQIGKLFPKESPQRKNRRERRSRRSDSRHRRQSRILIFPAPTCLRRREHLVEIRQRRIFTIKYGGTENRLPANELLYAIGAFYQSPDEEKMMQNGQTESEGVQ